MANPNIVSVQTVRGKASLRKYVKTHPVNLLTNNSSSQEILKVNSIIAANRGVRTVNVTLQLVGTGTQKITDNVSIPANASIQIISKNADLYVLENHSLQILASSNDKISVVCSYEQISDSSPADRSDYLFEEPSPALYSFDTFTFTNAGGLGSRGPTSANLTIAYSGTSWAGQYISVANGVQFWTVPEDGTYRIEAAGASGGTQSQVSTAIPGYGYIVKGDFFLEKESTLAILVGQMGQDVTATSSQGAGGGGGSFVWIPGSTEPLIVGAGGNGESWQSHTVREPDGQPSTATASTATGGRGSTGSGWNQDGVNGDGTPANGHAQNIRLGGGFGANYQNIQTYGIQMFPVSGSAMYTPGGGFGGGGAPTPYEGGGGGGYYRGVTKATNDYSNRYVERGAVSYISPSASNRVDVGLKASQTHGYVRITKANNDPSVISGQQSFVSPGDYSWVVPNGVTSISVVAVGGGGAGDDGNSGDGGGGGGSGAGLAYASFIPVSPGNTVTITVGSGGAGDQVNKNARAANGTNTVVQIGSFTITAEGGEGGLPYSNSPGSYGKGYSFTNIPNGVSTGGNFGGNGGPGYNGGGAGGGAAGFSDRGGHGTGSISVITNTGLGLGSGGGGAASSDLGLGNGGGPGGSGQYDLTGGGGGGANIYSSLYPPEAGGEGNGSSGSPSKGGYGGWPGGGGGGSWDNNTGVTSAGGHGAVRIIWGYKDGFPRSFPADGVSDTIPAPRRPYQYYKFLIRNWVSKGSTNYTGIAEVKFLDSSNTELTISSASANFIFGSGYEASKAIDGITSTNNNGWYSINNGNYKNPVLFLNFSAPTLIDRYRIYGNNDGSNISPSSWHLLASNTTNKWVTLESVDNQSSYNTGVGAYIERQIPDPTSGLVIGEVVYTTPGTYSWIAPDGVTSISGVAVGGGGAGAKAITWWGAAGGGGGGLGWKNNIPVTPGQSYVVSVGAGGTAINGTPGGNGGTSYFNNLSTLAGYGGTGGLARDSWGTAVGGSYVGDGGGTGGSGLTGDTGNIAHGGGGAGGYLGAGGSTNAPGTGGGGGGGLASSTGGSGGGGGVGLFGLGDDGAANGGGGSGGSNGTSASGTNGGVGGTYGGGSGSTTYEGLVYDGAGGAVRLMWGGNRTFPNNATQVVVENDAGVINLQNYQASFTTPGTYSWVAPAGVTSVSVVCVGGGGAGASTGSTSGGGGGGGLGWKNYISVTPGSSYTIVVGQGGATRVWNSSGGTSGSNSSAFGVVAEGGKYSGTENTAGDANGGRGGGFSGADGGGNGGRGGGNYSSGQGGGGGAGGYTGNGGDGANSGFTSAVAASGSGGGGGGGGGNSAWSIGPGGGGVGLNGAGASGAGGINNTAGAGGSNGLSGNPGGSTYYVSGNGGLYGGGGGGGGGGNYSGGGANGAVQIIWGLNRRYPYINYTPSFTTNGIILHLDAANTTSYSGSGTTWNDLSGNNYTATFISSPTFDSTNGAINFSGSNYANVTDTPFRFTSPVFTLSIWFYWDGVNRLQNLMGKRNANSPYNQYGLGFFESTAGGASNKLSYFARSDSQTDVLLQYPLTAAGFYNATVVMSASTQTLFVNGVARAVSSTNLSGQTYNITGANLQVGAATGSTSYYTGKISHVSVYNRSLTNAEVESNYLKLGTRYGLTIDYNNAIVTTNRVLHLDAADTSSYPGTGTVWYDMSGNNNNFNIVASAYNSSGPKYMDFNGSYGMAKNSADISLNDTNGVTYVIATRIKNSSGDWRTLTRSYVSDHHVIIYSGGWDIGLYDNDSAGFIGTGYSQQSLPNYGTSNWIIMYWRWQSASPNYQLSYNDTPGTIRGSITNASARYNRGFGAIGGYHSENTTPSSGSQYWGDIGTFIVYNRYLTDSELLQNFNALRGRYGL